MRRELVEVDEAALAEREIIAKNGVCRNEAFLNSGLTLSWNEVYPLYLGALRNDFVFCVYGVFVCTSASCS